MRRLLAIPALSLLGCAAPPAAPPPVAPPVAPVAVVAPAPAPMVHVQVLALNDFHGNLAPPHGQDGSVLGPGGERVVAGGAAYLAAHVRRLAKANPNTVVVSAGDLTGASPLASNLFHDEPTVLAMNLLGLDFEGVGNHDLDRGLAELTRLQRGGVWAGAPALPSTGAEPPFPGARFQYLAANVLGPEGKPIFPPYAIRDLGGVKVAFLGMTLEGTGSVTTKEAVRGLTFANEAKTANALLPELRERGVATTVILLHQGGFQEDGGTFDGCKGLRGDILPVLDALDPAFRVVVTAHTHQAYDCTLGGRVVTSAASYGRLITAIDLTLDPNKNDLVDVHAQNVPVTRDAEPAADVASLVADYEKRASPVTERVVGYQRGPLTRDPRAAHSASCETPLGDVIADAQLAATKGAGAVLALMNPGGIRTDLVTLTVTGAQLRALLERQFKADRPRVLSVSKGFSYRYTYDRATKSAAVDGASMRLDGKVIDPARRYRITVNSFLADGGDGFAALREAPERTEGALDIDALVAFLGRTTSARAPLAAPLALHRVTGNACE